MTQTTIDGIDYGPLAALIGKWAGDKGLDVAPESDGIETNPYYETLLFEAIGDVTNAEQQKLTGLRYHQVVSRKSNNKVFHNETGYWMWDASADLIIRTLTIPRGVALVAGGQADEAGNIHVQAACDDADWPIAQSPFMRDKAKTLSYEQHIQLRGDQLAYSQTTVLDIYGEQFVHTDVNDLTRQ